MSPTQALRVAITGGIGSGKSTVCTHFAALGVAFVDVDDIAHALTQPGGMAIKSIADTFGSQFIDSKGAMDRNLMRNHVFTSPSAKQQLESILHPLIRQETDRQANQAAQTSPYVLVAIPLLFESMKAPSAPRYQRIVVVDCSVQEQRRRIAQRGFSGVGSPNGTQGQIDSAQIDRIIAAQASREQRLSIATEVLSNRDFQADLPQQIATLHQFYSVLAT